MKSEGKGTSGLPPVTLDEPGPRRWGCRGSCHSSLVAQPLDEAVLVNARRLVGGRRPGSVGGDTEKSCTLALGTDCGGIQDKGCGEP